jgi:hypothetical protein
MIVRPCRRTTFDPSFFFNDLSEFLTFIGLSLFAHRNGQGRATIPSGPTLHLPADVKPR